MAKFNWKSKKTWKNALVIGLACITIVGAFVGLSALFRKSEETTKVVNPTYAVGGLTEQGAYLETKESMYTEDAFECQGLDIELDFRSNISYRVFFYDNGNNFLSSTDKLTANYDETSTPFLAQYVRVVITPNDDKEIKWYEKNGYADQLTISVDKEQLSYEDRLEKVGCETFIGMKNLNITSFGTGIYNGDKAMLTADPSQTNYWYNGVDLSDYDTICVKYLYEDYANGEDVEFVEIGLSTVVFSNPIELGHFVDGDYVYVVVDTATMSGTYSLHTKTSSASCELFEIFA